MKDERMTSGLEDESSAAASARRARRLRRWLTELALGLAFLAAIFGADHFAERAQPAQNLAAACVVAAIGVLALWFAVYFAYYRWLDEFERNLEVRAIALAGGVAVWLAAAWGLIEVFLGGPDFPIAFLAPVFSAIYAIIRTLFSLRYR